MSTSVLRGTISPSVSRTPSAPQTPFVTEGLFGSDRDSTNDAVDDDGFTPFTANRRSRRSLNAARREQVQATKVPPPKPVLPYPTITEPVRSTTVAITPTSIAVHPTVARLQEMFPHLSSALILNAFDECDGQMNAAVEYLLVLERSVAETQASEEEKAPKPDLLTTLPEDVLLHILDALDMFDLSRLSCTSRLCAKQVTQRCEQVDNLNLSRYRFWPDWKLLRMLARFPHLTRVSLSKCKDFTRFRDIPAAAPNATSIDLGSCDQLADEGVGYIAQWLPRLESIDLSASAVSDEGLEVIASNLDRLETLTLDACVRASEKGFSTILNRMSGLRYLSLHNTRVNCGALAFSKPNKLEELDVSKCKRLSNFVLNSRFCTLRVLNLSSNIGLLSCVLHIASLESLNISLSTQLRRLELRLPQLKSLNASGCVLLRELVIHGQTKLQTINLHSCRSLINTGFVALIESCLTTVESVNGDGMISLVDDSLSRLFDPLAARLRTVSLKGCKGLSANVQQQLATHLEDAARRRRQAEASLLAAKAAAQNATSSSAISSILVSPALALLARRAQALELG